MVDKRLAGDHYPGLVRPHPPMPGVSPPPPGINLLELLTEPEEPTPSSAPARDPVPMVLAGVAATFATVALGVAILTWMSVSGLKSMVATGGQPTTVAAASAATGPEQVTSGAPRPLGAPPVVAADGPPLGNLRGSNYALAYPTQSLQLSLPPCKSAMVRYVDVDEPRVDADASRADLYYQARSGCYGMPQLHLIGAVAASVVTKSSLLPAQCVTDIRNAPANTPILLSRAMNICVATSSDAAVGQDISQKVAMLQISDPTAGGSATIRITAWQVTP